MARRKAGARTWPPSYFCCGYNGPMKLRTTLSLLVLVLSASAGGADSVGLKPLTELTGTYKGESGGLYGNGRNEPPEAHRQAALREAARVEALERDGRPSKDGHVVLVSIGMSNTTQEFSAFKAIADRDPEKSAALTIVDGAQGGQAAEEWANEVVNPSSGKSVWGIVEKRLSEAGVTAAQVQAGWLKQALVRQGPDGDFPAHARRLPADLVKILQPAPR